MTPDREKGYILAGATVSMLLISLTAAALVTLAANDLRRTATLETRTEHEALLRGALRVVSNELASPPRQRSLSFNSENSGEISLEGYDLTVQVRAERQKIDLNHASEEVIRQGLNELDLPGTVSARIWETYQSLRGHSRSVELVDDVLPSIETDAECLHTHFTVFDGWHGREPRPETPDFNDTLRPGERVQITLSHPELTRTLSAVVLIVGPVEPAAETLDLRLTPANHNASRRTCHAI